jgi:RNA polymerase sigma factor (sigma-70 family)
VSLCLNGDSQAWEALVRRYRRLIWSIALKFNLAAADAADVFQTTCVIWIENLHSLRNEERLLEWLITTAKRECLHVQTARLREVADLGGQLEEFELATFMDPNQDLEEWRTIVEQEQALRDSLEELAEPCRSLIELIYFENPPTPYEEVADKLSLPVGSVGPTRARCLDKLRTRLRRRGVTANF